VLTNVTSGMGVLSIMGPQSRDLLQSLTPDDLSDRGFPFGTSRVIELGYALVRASRITYVGELGWEIYIPTEFMAGVYEEIVGAGPQHRSGACGLPRAQFAAHREGLPAFRP
jgi:glycine cleavage system aminomethyltransferase T